MKKTLTVHAGMAHRNVLKCLALMTSLNDVMMTKARVTLDKFSEALSLHAFMMGFNRTVIIRCSAMYFLKKKKKPRPIF